MVIMVVKPVFPAELMIPERVGKAVSYYFGPWEGQCTASHREGPEHDQHDVCDQYTRKDVR